MFVVAAAGARVAKHGNRSVSSKSGSADVLEALGVQIELAPEQVAECIERTGIGFMFAPVHHPAMKVVAPVRKEMGVRTIFNILGPLTNPAGAPNILMGVFHPDLVGIQVRVLQELGAQRALVVWGRDGMDELSLGAGTLVGELRDGVVREYDVHPEDFGIAMAASRNLRVNDAAESKVMLLAALEDTPGLPREIVALNAGAALYVAGKAESLEDGIALARRGDRLGRGAREARRIRRGHACAGGSRRMNTGFAQSARTAVLRGDLLLAAQRRRRSGLRRGRRSHARTRRATTGLPRRRKHARQRRLRHHRVLLGERSGDRRVEAPCRTRRHAQPRPQTLVRTFRIARGESRARLRQADEGLK